MDLLCSLTPLLSLVSPQSDKLSYAAALQAGGSSHSSGQVSSSNSASPQVLNTPSFSALKGSLQTPVPWVIVGFI